jgi:RNA polymerase sigma factor (sigma-70 family)
VALNVAITNLRKDIKNPFQQNISLSELEIPDMNGLSDESDNLTKLKQAIELLTKVERAIIMLHLDEKSYVEISDIIGISVSNVGVRLNRIKNKLEKTLNSK